MSRARAVPEKAPAADRAPLIVFDAARRTYIGLANKREYWHVVRPARPEDAGVVWIDDRPDPPLVCSCPAGRRGRSCYRVDEAVAYEAGHETLARPLNIAPGQTGAFEEPTP